MKKYISTQLSYPLMLLNRVSPSLYEANTPGGARNGNITSEVGNVVPYSKRARVPELIPVLGSQPAGDRSYKPGGRLFCVVVGDLGTVAVT